VVETDDHITEAIKATDAFRASGFTGTIYLMPVGGTLNPYDANTQLVAQECILRGFNFSPRLHISLFGNSWGT
jgi:hypothetical protein